VAEAVRGVEGGLLDERAEKKGRRLLMAAKNIYDGRALRCERRKWAADD
jgi:hypothetical protein